MTAASNEELLDDLAEEFLQRLRHGETVSLSEYVGRYPDLEADIRDVFPAMQAVEGLRRDTLSSSGTAAESRLESLGEYAIIRELGRGGMGVVYEAEQSSLGRRVALKVLPVRHQDEKLRQRFEREARAAAGLHHPNIVPVFAVGEIDGTLFFTMQLIDGKGLDEVISDLKRLRRTAHVGDTNELNAATTERDATSAFTLTSGTSSFDEAAGRSRAHCAPFFINIARFGAQVADALHYAHSQQVVHRDVKPSNLLLDQSGNVWVTDFGLAVDSSDEKLTKTGDVVGTVRYMPPERFHGWTDPRSDVYSLGITLYELATLTTPFAGRDRATLIHSVINDSPPSLRRLEPEVPGDLETIILKAIEREPSHRYRTADELADELRRFVAGEPIRTRRASQRERFWRWCRRNRVIAGLSGALALLLIAMAIGSVLFALSLSRAHSRVRRSLAEETTAKELAELRETRALSSLYDAKVAQARYLQSTGRVGQRMESLVCLRDAVNLFARLDLPTAQKLPLRNLAIKSLTTFDLEHVQDAMWGFKSSAEVDYARQRYAVACNDRRRIEIRSLVDNVVTHNLCCDETWNRKQLRFSRDGRFLAVAADRRDRSEMVVVWDLNNQPQDTGATQAISPLLVTAATRSAMPFSWSPDSNLIAISRRDQRVELLKLPENESVAVLDGKGDLGPTAFSPDGNRLAIRRTWCIQIIDRVTREVLRQLRLKSPLTVKDLKWTPDGLLLGAAAADGCVYIWDTESSRLVRTLSGHADAVLRLEFDDASRFAVVSSYDGTSRVWSIGSGDELLVSSERLTTFEADGSIVGRGSVSRCLSPVLDTAYCPLPRIAEDVGLAIHPAGELLVTGTRSELLFWDLANRRQVAHVSRPGGRPKFSADGAWLFTESATGIVRRAVRREATASEVHYHIGAQQELTETEGYPTRDQSEAAEYLSMSRGEQARIVDASSGQVFRFRVSAGNDVRHDVTPDGRFLTTSNWNARQVQILDATNGNLVHAFPSRNSYSCFTPDGARLVISEAGRCSFFDVASGKLVFETAHEPQGSLFADVAFDTAGTTVAVRPTEWRNQIQLRCLATYEILATFKLPRGHIVRRMALNSDASQLVAVTRDGSAIHFWNVGAIRQKLDEWNLGWGGEVMPRRRDRTEVHVLLDR